MTRFALLALLVGGCTDPASAPVHPAPETSGPAGQRARCDLTIRFGSYAMGIDRGAYARVREMLLDPAVRSVTEEGWGREGEVTLCASMPPADADRLFDSIRSALPARPTGPIVLATAAGRRFDAPRR